MRSLVRFPRGLPLTLALLLTGAALAEDLPFFEGLGDYRRPVTTSSGVAQRYFDQGLAFLHGFNHDEAIRSFQAAARADPQCAMAHWGIALACGPHINNPAVPPARAALAWDALEAARRHADAATPVEQALIAALGERYANPPPEDRAPLDRAYAEAMRTVWARFPQDPDAGALCAESLMDLRPWDLWTPDGRPQPGTEEIVGILEAVMRLYPTHPLANHLYIHAVEASPTPEQAVLAADRLRNLQPGLSHNVHMPSHIDVLLGRWHQAIEANERAVRADAAYREASGMPPDFYHLYMAHNRHMLTYAALMTGQSELALRHIRAMVAELPDAWVRANASFVDAFVAAPWEVLVRFGRWEEILAEPAPEAHLLFSQAIHHAARGMAWAAKGNSAEARREQAAFAESREAVPAEWTAGNNSAAAVLQVAGHLLEGEILYREGQVEAAVRELRRAVELEDGLRYDEPPGWILPVRHTLGATLMREGRASEAETVYREDLEHHPANGWSLFGLAQSLRRQDRDAEAQRIQDQFAQVWAKADTPIPSSCLCLPDAHETQASGGSE